MEKIPAHLDRRRKLSDLQKETIAHLVGSNIAELARYYGVSRRTIQFLMYPDRKAEMLRKRAESGGSKKYHNKERQRLADLNTIEYRKQLKEQGLI